MELMKYADLVGLLEDIVASSDANDGDSLMNAIEAAKAALEHVDESLLPL